MKKFAVKMGTNKLEQNTWPTSPARPYVVTGTVGERWPIKPSNLTAYDVRETKAMAKLYDPRVINGSIMQTTYDHAWTQDEIREKYGEIGLKL